MISIRCVNSDSNDCVLLLVLKHLNKLFKKYHLEFFSCFLCVFFWTFLGVGGLLLLLLFFECGPVFQKSPRVFSYVLIILISELSPKAI